MQGDLNVFIHSIKQEKQRDWSNQIRASENYLYSQEILFDSVFQAKDYTDQLNKSNARKLNNPGDNSDEDLLDEHISSDLDNEKESRNLKQAFPTRQNSGEAHSQSHSNMPSARDKTNTKTLLHDDKRISIRNETTQKSQTQIPLIIVNKSSTDCLWKDKASSNKDANSKDYEGKNNQ